MSDNKNNNKENTENKKQTDNTIICEICGSRYYRTNRTRHEKTKKHTDAKYVWLERFEIIR